MGSGSSWLRRRCQSWDAPTYTILEPSGDTAKFTPPPVRQLLTLREGQWKPRYRARLLGAQERPTEAQRGDGGEGRERHRQPIPRTHRRTHSGLDLPVPEVLIPERPHELLRRCEAIRRQLLQGTAESGVHVGRDRRTVLRRRYGLARDDLAEHRLGRVTEVGSLAHQHLIQHACQRVGIARRSQRLIPRRLLRAHVVRSPYRQSRLCQAAPARRSHRECDTEVGHDGLAALDQDVARFDVAVDHSVFVGVLERTGDLRGKAHRLIHGKLLLTVDPVPEGLALDIGHDVEEEAVGFTGIEERQDVWMLQVGRDLDLGQEAFGSDHRSQLRLQDLESHLAIVLDVVGEIDRGHPAFAELTLDGVAAFEGGVQTGDGI